VILLLHEKSKLCIMWMAPKHNPGDCNFAPKHTQFPLLPTEELEILKEKSSPKRQDSISNSSVKVKRLNELVYMGLTSPGPSRGNWEDALQVSNSSELHEQRTFKQPR